MKIKWLLAILILIVFISGCVNQNGGDGVKPTYNDNALSMDVKIREKEENRRILPDSTIRMVVTLTNQVENATENVDLKFINPYGIHISRVDCGDNCICTWEEGKNPENDKECPNGKGKCYFNGCLFYSIQSQDKEEITFGLKIPSEKQISPLGSRELNPKIGLEYNYRGTSVLYIPIYKYGEEPVEPKKEFTQTTGPIHVSIDSDNWVRAGDLFPIYVDVEDVVHTSEKINIDKNEFEMRKDHAYVEDDITERVGRCDFTGPTNGPYKPKENITLPLINPLICTLKAEENPSAPMVKAPIIIDYSYRYKVEKTEAIKVEKALLGIF